MTQLASPVSDTVSEVLRSFAVRSTIFCLSELRSPWAFRVDGEPVAKFHVLLEGSALLDCGGDAVSLAAGDLVVLPRGTAHTLADSAGSPAPPLDELLRAHAGANGSRLRYGGDGPETRLLCGGFSLADGIPDSTLALFPDLVHVASDSVIAPGIPSVLEALKAGADDRRPGASAIVAKIADVLLAQALRAWLLEGSADAPADGRLILDDAIAKAVRLLNDAPSEPWTLDRLAREVGFSRTALSTKFRERVGQSPMRYVSELRLSRASVELGTGRLPLREVGRRAGYVSEAAFAKAFKRRYGISPGAYRRSADAPPRVEIAAIP